MQGQMKQLVIRKKESPSNDFVIILYIYADIYALFFWLVWDPLFADIKENHINYFHKVTFKCWCFIPFSCYFHGIVSPTPAM